MSVKKLKLTVDSHVHSPREREKLARLHGLIVREVSAMDFSEKVKVTLESTPSGEGSADDAADQAKSFHAEQAGNDGMPGPSDHPLSKLSERQRQVAELLCSHHSVKRIAGILYVSENTVKKHVQNIKKALEIEHSGADFVFFLKQMIYGK